ncbi:MAG TPA: hypothetical protein VMS17_08545 [Gemmataceae bacterium]|nr:hypothetical protein [Gemmataceae bacterium]
MRHAILAAVAAVCLGAAAVPVRADLISGSVAWDAGLSTPHIAANGAIGPIAPPQPPVVMFTNWSSWTFSNQSLPTNGKVAGDLNIATLIKGETAHWQDAPFTLTFVIHDGPNIVGAVTFSGVLNGALSKNATGHVTSSVHIDWLGPTTTTLDLDHHLYTLSVSSMVRDGALPDAGDLGGVRVDVNVRHNPEPASMVLAALALPALAFVGYRRNKRPQKS